MLPGPLLLGPRDWISLPARIGRELTTPLICFTAGRSVSQAEVVRRGGLIRAIPNPPSPGFRVERVRDEGKESWGSEEADNSSADEDKEQKLA